MEKIARAQTLGDADRAKYMRGQRSLEINPRHPLIRELKAQVGCAGWLAVLRLDVLRCAVV
jgi:HSP90 family molecular chaperone